MTPLARVHLGESGQKGRPGALPCAGAAEIRSDAGGGLAPPGSEAAFQANPLALSDLRQPDLDRWLWEGYPVLPQLRSTGKQSAN